MVIFIENMWLPFCVLDPLKKNPSFGSTIFYPNWVPAGMLSSFFYPYIVVIIFLQPRMASRADTSNSVFTLFPYRTNYRCFLTLILINKSPSKFPFLLSFIVSPSLTPLGITIYYLTLLFCMPLPLQLGQNYLILVP
jgi:hypothetical protein